MVGRVGIITCGIVLGAVLGNAKDAETSWPSEIGIVVIDQVGVQQGELKRAEKLAGQVFEKAGVHVLWEHSMGDSNCSSVPEDLVCIVVSIVPKVADTNWEVFGSASVVPRGMGKYVTVIYGRVRELESERRDDNGVLGYIIAHEAGHILLGANSHSQMGIMQPRWESSQLRKASMGGLLFTADQAKKIRERIRVTMAKKKEVESNRKATDEPKIEGTEEQLKSRIPGGAKNCKGTRTLGVGFSFGLLRDLAE